MIALLSLVVVVSGCAHIANQGSTSSTASVSVQNFSAFPSQVFDGQQTRLTMTLINDGEANAEDVSARLFNVPFSGDNSWGLGDNRTVTFGDLEPADPENNLPARESTRDWTLDAPELDQGVTIPYQFISRVYYKYQTRGTTSITLMDQQRYRDQGSASRPVLETTAGPIQMEIRTRSPIVFYPEDEGSRTTEMCVIVRNEGDGTPFLHNDDTYDDSSGEYDVDDENSNRVKLRIPDQGRIKFTPSEGSGENTAVVEFFGNRGISCFKIEVEGWDQGVGPQEEVPLVLETDYGYYKETDVSVTVEGNERFD